MSMGRSFGVTSEYDASECVIGAWLESPCLSKLLALSERRPQLNIAVHK